MQSVVFEASTFHTHFTPYVPTFFCERSVTAVAAYYYHKHNII